MKVMGIYKNLEAWDSQPPSLVEQFRAGADLQEGISGRVGPLDTTYENTEATCSYVRVSRAGKSKPWEQKY